MLLEVLKHCGPARLGLLSHEGVEIFTPNFFSIVTEDTAIPHDIYMAAHDVKTDLKPLVVDYGSLFAPKKIEAFGILPDHTTAFRAPREMAEYALERTLEFAKEYPNHGAVVHGSEYPDLRERCASELAERPLLVMAHGMQLAENPRLLVEIVTRVRKAISPNSALYYPFAPPSMFVILAYMGVDLFDSGYCMLKAREGEFLTPRKALKLSDLKELPCSCGMCRDKGPKEMDHAALLRHNFDLTLGSLREIREAIRDNSLRELVEERASGSVRAMAALRILDREKQDYLEEYTPIAP